MDPTPGKRDNTAAMVMRIHLLLWGVFFMLFTLFAMAIGTRMGNYYLISTPVLLLLGILALSKPEWVFIAGVCLINSKMVLPGFPGELELFHIFLLVAAVVIAIRVILTREPMAADPMLRFFALGYAIVAFYTMLSRGIGFQILGSDQVGGMRYVLIFIGSICIWFLPNIQLTPKTFGRVVVAYVLFGFLPVVAEGLLLLSDGKIQQQYYFVKIGFDLGNTLMASVQGEGFRFTSATSLGMGLTYLPILALPFRRKAWPIYLLCFSSGLILLGFAGFRNVFASAVLTILLTLTLLAKGYRKELWIGYVLAGLSVYTLILLSYSSLPYGMQRTFSFLPFVTQGGGAMHDAFSSTNFRYGVWQLAWDQVPEYLLLGRGMTYSYAETIALNRNMLMGLREQHHLYGLVTNIHNSPLETLLYLGIPGFVLMSAFNFRLIHVVIRTLKKASRQPNLYRVPILFGSMILVQSLVWWASFGNPYGSFLRFSVLYILFLRAIEVSTGQNAPQQDQEVPEKASSPAVPPHLGRAPSSGLHP